jgi:hypothetical protein
VDADQEDEVGQQQPDREAGLDDAGVAPLLLPRRVLVAHQDGAAPFGAECQTLDDADGHQQHRREHTHRGVGGQQADRERGQAHDDERGDQHGLAADLVAEVATDDAAEWAGGEADTEGREGSQRAGHRAGMRKERGAEVERRRRTETDEVVGLDHGADTGADRNPTGVLGAVHRSSHHQSVIAHEPDPFKP